MTPLEARLLLKNLVRDQKILRHSVLMESIMLKLAEQLGEEVEIWGLTGLLHDLDKPQTIENPQKHGLIAGEILEDEGCDIRVIEAVRSHSGNFPRVTNLQIAIYLAELFIEFIEKENLSVNDLENKNVIDNALIEHINECEKLGWTIDEFSDIILSVLKGENFWRS
jgi:putative nucleotidyltransferase with HDIG domain